MKDADDLADYGLSIEQVRAASTRMWTWTILSQRCDRTVEFAIVADDDVTGQDGSGDGTDPRTMLGRFANQHNEWVRLSVRHVLDAGEALDAGQID